MLDSSSSLSSIRYLPAVYQIEPTYFWLCIPRKYTAKYLIPIRGRKRARYGTELQYRYVQLGQSHCFFLYGVCLTARIDNVTPVSVRGRKGLTCSIRAPPCPRFDTLRQSIKSSPIIFGCVSALRGSTRPNI